MGDSATDLSAIDVTVCRSRGDQLALVGATSTIAIRDIPTADWQASISLDTVTCFVRAEIIAVASHDDLVTDLLGALNSHEMYGAAQAAIAAHPIRRALSNPIYAGITLR
ncbi:MAG: hypothetical protein MO852_01230 [Candidatus Devosia euplotis]|nr:hypothetical protein [Candidatus Devosia euplotis]